VSIFSIGADLKDLKIWRGGTPTQSSRGTVTKTFAYSHTLELLVDVQPVRTNFQNDQKGEIADALYECYVPEHTPNLVNGDQIIDPFISPEPSSPTLEVFNLKNYPSVSGLPAHSSFMLRKIKQ
jgi:hypothetical protein